MMGIVKAVTKPSGPTPYKITSHLSFPSVVQSHDLPTAPRQGAGQAEIQRTKNLPYASCKADGVPPLGET